MIRLFIITYTKNLRQTVAYSPVVRYEKGLEPVSDSYHGDANNKIVFWYYAHVPSGEKYSGKSYHEGRDNKFDVLETLKRLKDKI